MHVEKWIWRENAIKNHLLVLEQEWKNARNDRTSSNVKREKRRKKDIECST